MIKGNLLLLERNRRTHDQVELDASDDFGGTRSNCSILSFCFLTCYEEEKTSPTFLVGFGFFSRGVLMKLLFKLSSGNQ